MIANDMELRRYQSNSPRFSAMDSMIVERGAKDDWEALHALHYKSESFNTGARVWRCVTEEGDLVGVVVTSTVSLLLRSRHELFPRLKPGQDTKFTNTHRAVWLNQNFRRASRIVTDTLYRGVGVSYRMLNLAMRLEGIRYFEIMSSMSKFNPFDQRAGFRHGNINESRAYEAGMKFFRSYFSAHPADHMAIIQEFRAMPEPLRKRVDRALRDFYWKHSAKEKTGGNRRYEAPRIDRLETEVIIKELQQLIFASPVYGVWENPDLGRELPERLPLCAFDLQAPNQPLRMDLL